VNAPAKNPRFGYVLAITAATLWSVNGSLARYLLDDGVSAMRLAQLRSLLSLVILIAALAVIRPALLRVERTDVPRLAFIGIAGMALVHATYFIAIKRLDIGVALTIEYLGPILILLWLRIVHGRRMRPGLWGAAALSVAGCFLVVKAYDISSLSGVGIAAALASAVTFSIAMYGGEQAGRRLEPVTTLVWSFGFASLFWAIAQPLWSFPVSDFAGLRNTSLGLGVVVIGTLLPFGCMLMAVRHIPASRAAIVATLEPVLGAAIAWPVHHQVLAPVQIVGGLLVVAAVIWVQSHTVAPDEAAVEHVSKAAEAAAIMRT
jgi:drug/metabolite transporter (DMT)-like permease